MDSDRLLGLLRELRFATIHELHRTARFTSHHTTTATKLDRLYRRAKVARVRLGRKLIYCDLAACERERSVDGMMEYSILGGGRKRCPCNRET